MAAFSENRLYVGGQGDSLKDFPFDSATELFDETVASQSAHVFCYPGAIPSGSPDCSLFDR
jgi:hypothetical protein